MALQEFRSLMMRLICFKCSASSPSLDPCQDHSATHTPSLNVCENDNPTPTSSLNPCETEGQTPTPSLNPPHSPTATSQIGCESCENYSPTATGICLCYFETLQDGSLDFDMLAKGIGLECTEEVTAAGSSHQEEQTDHIRIGNGVIFSVEELDEAINFFNPVQKLGEGGYGSVFLAKLKDGQTVVVKILCGGNGTLLFQTEVSLLSKLHHRNLVNFLGCTSFASKKLCLVYEYMSNGTVADYLHGERKASGILTLPLRIRIAIETAEALVYLHSWEDPVAIIHGDIKTDNILLDDKFHVKIADFGLCDSYSRNIDPKFLYHTPGGTRGYLDPEFDLSGRLTDKSDVYSFGVLLLELLSGELVVDVNRLYDDRDDVYLVPMALRMIQNKQLDQLVDRKLGYYSDKKIKELFTKEGKEKKKIKKLIDSVIGLACECLKPEGASRPPMKEVILILKSITKSENNLGQDTDVLKEIDVTDLQVPVPENNVPLPPLAIGMSFDEVNHTLIMNRVALQDSGVMKMFEEVRRVYRHDVSSIVLFIIFKNAPHGRDGPDSCHCRRYMNDICLGLQQSRCFWEFFLSYIAWLAVVTESPWGMVKRNFDRAYAVIHNITEPSS